MKLRQEGLKGMALLEDYWLAGHGAPSICSEVYCIQQLEVKGNAYQELHLLGYDIA
jgi:hypothetical protein